MQKTIIILFLICLVLLLSACKAECPPERISYASDLSLFPPKTQIEETASTWTEIKGKEIQVDRIVTGPVCNDTLSGVVYMTCDIQIPAWEKDPFFWQDCDFRIEEGTNVYVEAHNDKQYDKGCSCHE
jgi:hypothetical protein